MLEQIDLSKKMNEKEYNEAVSHLEIRLAQLQRKCREHNIPVMIFMEGLEAAGKGTMINRADPVSGSQRFSGICHGK